MTDSANDTESPGHTRKLVTVRRVSGIEKDKKHNREFVRLDGWTVYVAPKRYCVGDFVVFFEIDSFLPKSDGRYWELVAYDKSVFHGKEGYRVKSRRVGKRVSQGLVFPMHEFPEITEVWHKSMEAMGEEEGQKSVKAMSFEAMLGVQKYVAEMDYNPHASLGPPPGFIHQPAWERAQNIGDLFRTRGNTMYQITEKLDGWSMSVYWVRHDSRQYQSLTEIPAQCKKVMEKDCGRVGVCSRTQDWLENGENLFWKIALELDLPNKIQKIGRDVAVQGELVGSTILGNSMGFADGEHAFLVFAIWDIDRQRYMSVKETKAICNKLDMPHTPIIGYSKLNQFASGMNDLVNKAEGMGMKGRVREGLVFKTMDGQKQFKVISNTWLIQRGE
ncbi:DNA ligase/mRNA capping enzyme [Coniochaeta sp. PMI_546]|nr:DNA ligase/mRNA capping enzyme [Coniochaeta sp. PMI_546]